MARQALHVPVQRRRGQVLKPICFGEDAPSVAPRLGFSVIAAVPFAAGKSLQEVSAQGSPSGLATAGAHSGTVVHRVGRVVDEEQERAAAVAAALAVVGYREADFRRIDPSIVQSGGWPSNSTHTAMLHLRRRLAEVLGRMKSSLRLRRDTGSVARLARSWRTRPALSRGKMSGRSTGLFEVISEPGGIVLFQSWFCPCLVMGELSTKAEACAEGWAGGGFIG